MIMTVLAWGDGKKTWKSSNNDLSLGLDSNG